MAVDGDVVPVAEVNLQISSVFRECFTQVVEGTQVRLLRMLFRSLPVGARCLSEMHADFLQKLGRPQMRINAQPSPRMSLKALLSHKYWDTADHATRK